MKNTDGTDHATTSVSLTLSKEELLLRKKQQIAFNNSPEAAQIDKEFLESLKEEQRLDQEILDSLEEEQRLEKAIHERQISLKDDKSSQFLQDQKAFSESPEARQIVDEVIEALRQERLEDEQIRKDYGLK